MGPRDSGGITAPPRSGPLRPVPAARRGLRRETAGRRHRPHHPAGPGPERRRGPDRPARRRPDAGPGGAPRPFPLGASHGAHVLGATVAGTGQRDRPARNLRRARIVSATPLPRLGPPRPGGERGGTFLGGG